MAQVENTLNFWDQNHHTIHRQWIAHKIYDIVSRKPEMKEDTPRESGGDKRAKQQIMVPFLWEEKPGIPKKDWKPETTPTSLVPYVPAKFVVSVPFMWEEKPGTPLQRVQKEALDVMCNTRVTWKKSLPLPPGYYCNEESDEDFPFEDPCSGADADDKDWLWDLDMEVLSMQTSGSYASAPSLLANGLVPTSAVSSAVPIENVCHMKHAGRSIENRNSPESTAILSSYATGNMSLVGVPFLEQLFPLYSPKSSFMLQPNEQVTYPRNQVPTPEQYEIQHFGEVVGKQGVAIRRPVTLGELILQSRRRSYRKKAVQMRKHRPSKYVAEKEPLGCCMFGPGNPMLAALEKLIDNKKQLLMLK
ncbi:hypothetical protein AKJ16_DCAP05424, partial [Drosera capensis]